MKFNILKEELEKALAVVGRAVNGKNVRPILNGIKMELNEKGLFLTTSDSNVSIVTKIPVSKNEIQILTIYEEGALVIGARQFIDIVRKMSGERLEFEMIENNVLKIKDSISNFSLNCMNTEDYPMLDFNFPGSSFELNAKDFSKAIDQTSYAASLTDTRPVLQGVNITANGNNIEWVATDGIRIAKKIVHIEEESNFSVTVPAKTLNDVARIADGNEKIAIVISEKKIVFRFSSTLVAAGIINNPYPNTAKLFKDTYESKLEADSAKLIASIDRTSTLGNGQSTYVRFSMSESEVKIMARTQETGSGDDTLVGFDYVGDRLDIAFTSKFIADAIKAIGGETIIMNFNGENAPVIIRSKEDDTVLALIQRTSSW